MLWSIQILGDDGSTSIYDLMKSAAQQVMSKVYELRTYKIYPHYYKQFLGLTQEHLYLRTAHSKLLGYWTSELGGLNEVFHIWEYESLEQRGEVRTKLANDPRWISDYFSKILPMMSVQENSVCQLYPGTDLSFSKSKGSAYNLVTLRFKAHQSAWKKCFEDLLQELNNAGHLTACFDTIHGRINEVVLLVQHTSLSQGADLVQKLSSFTQAEQLWSSLSEASSKLMTPFAISPLQ
ncbi:protein NipSnap homolog 3A-like isoform X2 [Artemia franciscana]